ncbi:MAG: copper resistance system multicopper oxidase [Novosphingobium sp.]|uniref:copper resistance system multicopper oxidase n=1 Tax=Novosphingobium sp. TaxID=1874826 RepID=UPI00391C755D|nr:copper resistance system multicopper oxidase [Novosphingobium sp.]
MVSLSRRRFLTATGAGLALAPLPAWAQGHGMSHGGHGGSHRMPKGPLIPSGFGVLTGKEIDLTVADGLREVAGRRGLGVAVNGTVPGPLLRLKEGDEVTLRVTNRLHEDTSIHWHGLLLPFQFDGVPGVSFPGIKPGETFTYKFPLRQSGTYWYHSHSGLQEQSGHYGPLIIDPAEPDPIQSDREFVLLLSEFTAMHPHKIFDRLRTGEGYFNRQKTTWTNDYPMTGAERRMWAQMRMPATDIADVSAPTYTYLANGLPAQTGPEFLFRRGERVRLRLINGSAMTFFNVRIPGLKLTVVAADGQAVKPVTVEELQIAVAETYDLLVEPDGNAFSIVCESMDRSGMALATLTTTPGLRAPVPPLRQPPLLTMADMGMNHGDGGHDHGGAGKSSTSMDGMPMRDISLLPPDVKVGPGIDMVSMAPVDKLGDPGIGLADVGHRVLTYRDLSALTPNADTREPSRLLELHLTGNMERYMWSFDGRMFNAVSDVPIRFAWNERVRVKLVNNTMMAHPIHLHGMFFELVNGQSPANQPRKNVVTVQPGASAQFDLTANEPGDWAFHCHLLYHMHGGMMQIVTVMGPEGTK